CCTRRLPTSRVPVNPPSDPRSDCQELPMFEFRDLFQWDRFITPTIIKTFYWLVIVLMGLFALSGVASGLAMVAVGPFAGFFVVLSAIAVFLVVVVFARIIAEFILIVCLINEHLGAIRDRGRGM